MSKILTTRSKVTMRDIAAIAGVSTAAVSAALSPRPGNIGVGKAKRHKILKIAQKLNYQTDIVAKSLSIRKSFLLGVLCRETQKRHTLEVLCGVQDVCCKQGYSVVTYFHGDKTENELEHIRLSSARQVDGLIVMPAFDESGKTNSFPLLELNSNGIPVVQLFGDILPGIPFVNVDHRSVGKRGVEYLISLGHKRIAHFTHEGYLDIERPGFYKDARLVWEGYNDAMLNAGLEPLVITHQIPPMRQVFFSAYESVDKLIDNDDKPTAVTCYDDYEGLAILRRCRERQINVPDGLAIIGNGKIDAKMIEVHNLTTFQRDDKEIGRCAAKLCLRNDTAEDVQSIVLNQELSIGDTT